MSCGCGKKAGAIHTAMVQDSPQFLQPYQWGPILWKYLHILAERMGYSGNTVVDTDQASFMQSMLTMLPLMLPCQQCQEHAATYIAQTPVPTLSGLYGDHLRTTTRNWLFEFHNHVRTMGNQGIVFSDPSQCIGFYTEATITRKDYNAFVQTVATSVRMGWVRMENWRKWYSYSERLRILSGNMIV